MPWAMTLSRSAFWRGCGWFHPFTFAHVQGPFFTHQQRGKTFHNLFLSFTKNHLVLVSKTKSRAVKCHLRAGARTSSLTTPKCAHAGTAIRVTPCSGYEWSPELPASHHLYQTILNITSILTRDDFPVCLTLHCSVLPIPKFTLLLCC